MKKALLFINGMPPKNLPNLEAYDLITCLDGAFHYLEEKNFPFEKLDFTSGDFDSYPISEEMLLQARNDHFEIIQTPNQDQTDFEKSLEIILERGISEVDVFGGSGGEMDHFLGNITVAFKFKDNLKIKFFDEFSEYFFSTKSLVLENVRGEMISLYPFPIVENITTRGLNWELNNETLSQLARIGTRNFAVENQVSIEFYRGDLLVFIGKK